MGKIEENIVVLFPVNAFLISLSKFKQIVIVWENITHLCNAKCVFTLLIF